MTDEEKKAIEMIEHIQECNTLIGYRVEDRTILAKALLNLIEKQSKEIEELKASHIMTHNKSTNTEKAKIFDVIDNSLDRYIEKKFPVTITKEELEKRWKGVDIWKNL